MSVGHELVGRGGSFDRLTAAHPWFVGIAAGLLLGALGAGVDAALGGSVSWLLVVIVAVGMGGAMVAKGYQRRGELARRSR